jgi:hypothetical protein
MYSYHEAVLAAPQQTLLRTLGPFATQTRHYLAGGTAVALRLGHRESIDFDFFSANPAVHGGALQERLREVVLDLETTDVSEGTFNGVANGVKVSFFRYRYPLLEPAERWCEYDVDVLGLRDLAAMKLAAIAQRGLKKDFLDIHAMLRHGLALPDMFDWYCKKFDVRELMPVRRGLLYFDDAESQPMPRMLRPVEWSSLKNAIRIAVRQAGETK